MISGASRARMLRTVTLPLVWPGVLAAAIFVVTIAISAFDVPLFIGQSHRIATFSTYLYSELNPTLGFGTIDYGGAAAVSSVVFVFSVLLATLYVRVLGHARRYHVITGRGYTPRLVRLGRWRIAVWILVGVYFAWGIVVTIGIIVWTAIQPFPGLQPSASALRHSTLANFRGLPWATIRSDVGHTLVLMVVAPTAALALSLVFSLVVLRSRLRWRFAYDFVAFLPQAVPSVILAFAAFVGTLFFLPSFFGQDFYQSLTLLVIVMSVILLAFGTRMTNGALLQIHPELEDAGVMAGASSWRVLRTVTLPLLRPALASSWLWMSLLAFRELTVPAMLQSGSNETLAVLVYSTWQSSETRAAAITCLMLAVLVPLLPLYWRLQRHWAPM